MSHSVTHVTVAWTKIAKYFPVGSFVFLWFASFLMLASLHGSHTWIIGLGSVVLCLLAATNSALSTATAGAPIADPLVDRLLGEFGALSKIRSNGF